MSETRTLNSRRHELANRVITVACLLFGSGIPQTATSIEEDRGLLVMSYVSESKCTRLALTAIPNCFDFEDVSSLSDSIKRTVNVFQQIKYHRRVPTRGPCCEASAVMGTTGIKRLVLVLHLGDIFENLRVEVLTCRQTLR
jgi:hypothetical protein